MCPICDRLGTHAGAFDGAYCLVCLRFETASRTDFVWSKLYFISNFLILTLKILYVRRWKVLTICEDSQYYIGG